MLGLVSHVAAWSWHPCVPLQQPEQLQVTSPARPPVFATTCSSHPQPAAAASTAQDSFVSQPGVLKYFVVRTQ